MVASAALNVPNTNYETYFFKDDEYIKVKWTPGVGGGDSVTYGPAKFADDSPSLKATRFSCVDAILPIPGHEQRAYFFRGTHYARIDFFPGDPSKDKLHNCSPIAQNWASLKKAGFDHVDGAIMATDSTTEAVFFSGEKYCRVSFKEGSFDDELLDGPRDIATDWPSTGFKSVDVIVPRPGGPTDRAYVFSGPYYVQTEVTTKGERKVISDPRDVASWWKGSLGAAGFY